MNPIKIIMAGALVLSLSACATTQSSSEGGSGSSASATYTSDASPEARLLGEYLIGTYADDIGAASKRAEHYISAYEMDKSDINLARRAITSAIAIGDDKTALKLAEEIEKTSPDETMTRAYIGTQAFVDGDYAKAGEHLRTSPADVTVYILANLVQGWNQAALGDPSAARTTFSSIGGGRYFDILGRLQVANLEASLGNIEAAELAFAEVDAAGLSPIETNLARARALSRSGSLDAALKILQDFNADKGPFETGRLPVYIATLEAGEPIKDVLTPQQHASRALTEAAYGFFLRNQSTEGAEIYLRFARLLDPTHDKATLWLGALVESEGRNDDAMDLFKTIPDGSPYIVAARLSQANIYFAREDDETALKILEKTNDDHPTFTTRESLGRARLIRENYAEALPIYDALLSSMTEDEIRANVEPLYFRGICYERLKLWDSAVADFKRVLTLDPDHADTLNYLGYTWVDRNENLEEAFEMIRKAVRLEPESGAIVDSLGWAHYKLGQYSEARIQLEHAVELSPSSATIIDHLGDVYWKLGRFREARYQWERALIFDPTDEEVTTIEKKLKDGLISSVQG